MPIYSTSFNLKRGSRLSFAAHNVAKHFQYSTKKEAILKHEKTVYEYGIFAQQIQLYVVMTVSEERKENASKFFLAKSRIGGSVNPFPHEL